MTESDMQILRTMSDPKSHVTSLTDRDKAAVQAALTELRELWEQVELLQHAADKWIIDLIELEG
jgi:hypothetical protein